MANAGFSAGLSIAILLAGASHAGAQELQAPGWEELIEIGRCADAQSLCAGRLASPAARQRAEAHKCLAYAALCGHGLTIVGTGLAGRRTLREDFLPGSVDKALGHLQEALKLTPDDLSLHQERLQLLGVSSRYAAMAEALDESCRLTPATPQALAAWLQPVVELLKLGEPKAALSLLSILDRRFPNRPQVREAVNTARAMHQALCAEGRRTDCAPPP